MTRTLVCLALCGTLLPRVASAQDMPPPWDPTLMITINAGLTSGGDLWELPPQPQFVIGNSALDTLHLGRVLRPGLVAGLGATYFFKPNFGLSGEVTYFGIAGEQRCRGPAVYQTDTLNANINQQACETANGTHVNTSVVGFLLGVTWRGSATARVQPLLRGMIGPGLIGNSYVKTTGTVFAPGICPIGCNVG